MVEVFVTNVTKKKDSAFLTKELLKRFPHSEINFDLEDSDRILRIEPIGQMPVACQAVILYLNSLGFRCDLLND
jgi:hypothetical protein